MKEWLKAYKLYVGFVALILVIVVYYFFSPMPTGSHIPIGTEDAQMENQKLAEEETLGSIPREEPQTIMVDMKGAINRPGVYEVSEGERVIDLVDRAGGFTNEADESNVNLAMIVEDEMVVYIPKQGEEGEAVDQGGTNATGTHSKDGKVNINKADSTELETLPGIGPSKSAAIIEYRETHGPFKSVEDIKSISGIGEKTFEKLKDKITVK